MDTILQYLKDNPKLVLVSAISLIVCLVFAIAVIIAKKAVAKKRLEQKTQIDNQTTQPNTLDEQAVEENIEKVEEKTQQEIDAPQEETLQEETVAYENKTEETITKDIKEVETEPEKALDSTVNKQIDDKKPDTRYSGKWVIIEEGKRFSAELRASNAEILLRTESYTALSGIKSGIETVKNNVEKNNFAVSMDKNGNFFFKLYSSSTRLLCVSEGYSTKAACERAIESVKRFSKTAVIVREKKDDEND